MINWRATINFNQIPLEYYYKIKFISTERHYSTIHLLNYIIQKLSSNDITHKEELKIINKMKEIDNILNLMEVLDLISNNNKNEILLFNINMFKVHFKRGV